MTDVLVLRSIAGFEIVDSVLSVAEVSQLLASLGSSGVGRSRAGARHLMQHPAVARTAHDERLLALARRFVGPDATPFRATLFDKSPSNNWLVVWHQDTALPLRVQRDVAGWGPWSVKSGITYAHAPADALSRVVALRLSLDASDLTNGPLRVIPETHCLGLLSDAEIARLVHERQPVDCVVGAGGVVAMRPLILHASSKAASDRPRRVLHIEYAESLAIGDGLDLAIA
jgi:hypothetical protein